MTNSTAQQQTQQLKDKLLELAVKSYQYPHVYTAQRMIEYVKECRPDILTALIAGKYPGIGRSEEAVNTGHNRTIKIAEDLYINTTFGRSGTLGLALRMMQHDAYNARNPLNREQVSTLKGVFDKAYTKGYVSVRRRRRRRLPTDWRKRWELKQRRRLLLTTTTNHHHW